VVEKKFVYVTTMYKHGEFDGHSYVAGIFSNSAKATKEGVDVYNRRGTYGFQVTKLCLNDPSFKEVIITHMVDHRR